MKSLINSLYKENNNIAYEALKKLELEASNSKEIYDYFDDILNMLDSNKSYIRIRGFRLICSLAKWDLDSKIDKNINVFIESIR